MCPLMAAIVWQFSSFLIYQEMVPRRKQLAKQAGIPCSCRKVDEVKTRRVQLQLQQFVSFIWFLKIPRNRFNWKTSSHKIDLGRSKLQENKQKVLITAGKLIKIKCMVVPTQGFRSLVVFLRYQKILGKNTYLDFDL